MSKVFHEAIVRKTLLPHDVGSILVFASKALATVCLIQPHLFCIFVGLNFFRGRVWEPNVTISIGRRGDGKVWLQRMGSAEGRGLRFGAMQSIDLIILHALLPLNEVRWILRATPFAAGSS